MPNQLYEQNFPHMSPALSRIFNFVADRAEGSYIYTDDGRKFLDFTCGIGVTNTGHCHPKVVEAIREQAGNFIHAQANIVIHKPMLQLIEELRTIVPPSIDSFFFANSGAEALENAVKIARVATGRQNVIVFSGSFHGRTVGTMALTTSKTVYRAGFGPLPSGVFVAPFPYAFRLKMTEAEASAYALEQLEYLLHLTDRAQRDRGYFGGTSFGRRRIRGASQILHERLARDLRSSQDHADSG